jgi:hypothetical protein
MINPNIGDVTDPSMGWYIRMSPVCAPSVNAYLGGVEVGSTTPAMQ